MAREYGRYINCYADVKRAWCRIEEFLLAHKIVINVELTGKCVQSLSLFFFVVMKFETSKYITLTVYKKRRVSNYRYLYTKHCAQFNDSHVISIATLTMLTVTFVGVW